MKTNYNDELQRCLDEDLNDEEMRILFSQMAQDTELRKDFRGLMALKFEFHRLNDERNTVTSKPVKRESMMMGRIIGRRLSISVPALAAVILMAVIGTYSLMRQSREKVFEDRYVYVMEMPAYIVQSSYTQTKNN